MIDSSEKSKLNTSDVEFRQVVPENLVQLFNQVIPNGWNGYKEKWEFIGREWKLVGSGGIVMTGTRIDDDGKCKITYISGESLVTNSFSTNSMFGLEIARDGTAAVLVKSVSRRDIPTIRRFVAVSEQINREI